MIGTSIETAAAYLRNNEVVAIPTETVYGLAGNAFSEDAVKKIYAIKNRPLSNPLIVHTDSIEKVRNLVSTFPVIAEKLASVFWPGPLTIILQKSALIPAVTTAQQDSVAIRIPNHPVTLRLLGELDFPLAAPSANRFAYISPVNAQAVMEMLGTSIPYILDGGSCKQGIESTIVSVENEKVFINRPGVITKEQIENTLSTSISVPTHSAIAHPGMFKKHYSPKTPMILTEDISETVAQLGDLKIAVLSFYNSYPHLTVNKKVVLSPNADMLEAAHHLYDALYTLDKSGFDIIIAEKFPQNGIGTAINDRLMKASEPF